MLDILESDFASGADPVEQHDLAAHNPFDCTKELERLGGVVESDYKGEQRDEADGNNQPIDQLLAQHE